MPGTELIFAVGDKDMNHRGSRLSQSMGPGWKNRHDLRAECSRESQVCVTCGYQELPISQLFTFDPTGSILCIIQHFSNLAVAEAPCPDRAYEVCWLNSLEAGV